MRPKSIPTPRTIDKSVDSLVPLPPPHGLELAITMFSPAVSRTAVFMVISCNRSQKMAHV
jgi:hypothetical protein